MNDYICDQNTRLENINSELSETNTSKDKFFTIIAHDLKNSIQSILFNSTLFAKYSEQIDNAKFEKLSNSLYQSTSNISGLLGNLLEWSRSKTGRIEFSPKSNNLHQVIEDNILLIKEGAEQKELSLINNIPNDFYYNFDLNMILAVIRNLSSNALKFSKNGGKITFSVDGNTHDDFITISVADTGSGILPEDMQNLFNINSTPAKIDCLKESGSGLGLIICKDFVEKHGGRIWAESVINEGATFKFTIPKQ